MSWLTGAFSSNPTERPTADRLLSQHPFCELDPNWSFYDTDLYKKINGIWYQ